MRGERWSHTARAIIRGALEGFRSRRVVDFRDQIGVYVLYDENRPPVFVGLAGGRARLFRRLRHHRNDRLALRWQYFSWFGLLRVDEVKGNLREAPLTMNVRGTLKERSVGALGAPKAYLPYDCMHRCWPPRTSGTVSK
jgi:hypothetical protein